MSFYEEYKVQWKQPNFINSIFMSTVNMATKMLLSVSSSNYSFNFGASALNNYGNNIGGVISKWKGALDHFKIIGMIFSWFTAWFFRVFTDIFPSFLSASSTTLLKLPALHGFIRKKTTSMARKNLVTKRKKQQQLRLVAAPDVGSESSSSSSAAGTELVLSSSASSSMYSYSPVQNLDLIPYDGFLLDANDDDHFQGGQSVQALGRALSHALTLLNELPATSRKYEFAMAMADRMLDDNTREGNFELLQVNRLALSSAFESTTNRLHDALIKASKAHAKEAEASGPWTTRLLNKFPLGSYIDAYMKGGMSALLPALDSAWQLHQRRIVSGFPDIAGEFFGSDQSSEVVGAEKLSQELLWITNKLRACHGEDEALVHWSLASGLASVSLDANPRVQASLIKISASLMGDIARSGFKVPTQLQYRLLVLWLPLFCYGSSGLRYPALSTYEKLEVERTIDQMIATLPVKEQEVVLRNWLQDFAICASDWPNLRPSYDRWCQSSRQYVT